MHFAAGLGEFRRRIALLLEWHPGGIGLAGCDRLVVRQYFAGGSHLGLGVIPLRLQRVTAFFCRVKPAGHDRDARRDFEHVDDAGHRLGGLGVKALELAAEARRVSDECGQHAGQVHVDRETRGAGALVERVEARDAFGSQQPELVDGFQWRIGGRFFQSCRLEQFAEACAARGRVVPHDPGLNLYFRCRHAPRLRGGGDEHRTRAGARLAQLQPGVADRGGATGNLQRLDHRVVIGLHVRGRCDDTRARPVRVEFLGDDRGHAALRALSKLAVLRNDRHGAVGSDPDEWPELRDRRLGAFCRDRTDRQTADQQAATGERGANDEVAARDRHVRTVRFAVSIQGMTHRVRPPPRL